MKTLLAVFLLSTLFLPPILHAQSNAKIKLHPHGASPANLYQFGSAAVMNDRWIIIGEAGNKEGGLASGAVHVFEAATGKHLRQILNPQPKTLAQFGSAVAMSGELLLVGALGAGSNSVGAAYLFDLKNGVLLRTITPPASGCVEFGVSVALSGRLAVIGDHKADLGSGAKGAVFVYPEVVAGPPGDMLVPADAMTGDEWGLSVALSGTLMLAGAHKQNASAGAAYLFDLKAGAQLRKFTGINNDQMGYKVALAGGKAVISLLGADLPVTDAGVVRIYDAESGIFLLNLSSPSGSPNHAYGYSLAATPDFILVGSPLYTEPNSSVDGTGTAYLFNARSGQVLRQFQIPERKETDYTGWAVALHGSQALVTTLLSDSLGPNMGAATLYPNQVAKLICYSLAAKNNSAPGLASVRHASFTESAIGPQSAVMFAGGLSGPGSEGGKTAGMFSAMENNGFADLALITGMDLTDLGFSGVKATSLTNPCCNSFSMGIFQAKLAGTGVTALNNQMLLADNGTEVYRLLRTGGSDPALGSVVISGIKQVLQGAKNDLGPAVIVNLKTGVGGVNKTNDSALLALKTDGDVLTFVREGNLSPPGDNFGQIQRAALATDRVLFCADLISGASTNQGLFILNTTFNTKEMLLRKGSAAPDVANAVVASFIGETIDQNNTVLARGTIAGTSVTSANKECLWRKPSGGMWALTARIGTQVQGMSTGIQWAKFLQYWTIGGQQVLVRGQIKGPDVAPATDHILWLAQEDGSHQVLLREGDAIPDCGHLRISVIQQVTAHSLQGRYAVSASLLGAPKDQDQVLLTGRTFGTNMALSSLRQPFARMRKGMLYDQYEDVITRLMGASWPTLTDTTGAGMKGLAQSINSSGFMALTLSFANGGSEVALTLP